MDWILAIKNPPLVIMTGCGFVKFETGISGHSIPGVNARVVSAHLFSRTKFASLGGVAFALEFGFMDSRSMAPGSMARARRSARWCAA
jgi:hypothetical protein